MHLLKDLYLNLIHLLKLNYSLLNEVQAITSLIKTANAVVTKDGDTVKVTLLAGKKNLSVFLKLKNGDPVIFENVEGMKVYKDGLRYVVTKDSTAEITLPNGKKYNLVVDMNAVKMFIPENVDFTYTEGNKYDAENHIMSLNVTQSFTRLYKNAVSSKLTVDADAYPFITETDSYYEINKTDKINRIKTGVNESVDSRIYFISVIFKLKK